MLNKNILLLIFLLAGVLCESSAVLFKRDDSDSSRVSADDFGSPQLQVFADTAVQQQLAFIGQDQKRNISDWIAYYEAQKDNFGDVPTIINNSPAAPVIRVVILGIVIGVLVSLCGLMFCCGRVLCNTCGGRKPDPGPNGYSSAVMYTCFAMTLIFSILCLAFAAVNITFSSSLGNTVVLYKSGIDQSLTDVNEFGISTVNGLSQAPAVADQVIQEIVANITGPQLFDYLNATVGVAVRSVTSNLTVTGQYVDEIKVDLNDAIDLTNSITSNVQEISDSLDDVNARITQLQTIDVNGTTYDISAQFPDLSQLENAELPDVSSIPDLSSFQNGLNNVPDLANVGNDLQDQYDALVSNFSVILNETIIDNLPSTQTLAGDSFTTLNDTLSKDIVGSVESLRNDIDNTFDAYIIYYNNIRNSVTLAFNILIIVSAVLAIIGIGLKQQRLMFPLIIFIVLFSVIIWVLFSVIYGLSAPVAVVCNSYDPVVNTNYALTGLSSGNNSGLLVQFENKPINPKLILDGCQDGLSLFDVPFNENGDTLVDILVNYVKNDVLNVSSFLNEDNFNDLVNLPDPKEQLDDLLDVDLSSINRTALQLPDIGEPINITSTIQNLNSSVQSLTVEDIDSDLGNQASLQSAITAFNSKVQEVNPSFPGWTYTEIVDNYIIPQQAFYPEDATLDANDPRNAEVADLWYNSGGVLQRASFNYYATRELNELKANITDICNQLQSLQDNQIPEVYADYDELRTTASSLNATLDNLLASIDDLTDSISDLTRQLSNFLNWALQFATRQIKDGITNMLTTVLVQNPSEDFGKCEALSQDIGVLTEGICVGFLTDLSGLWYSYLFLGVFAIFALIVAIYSKKRVEYLQTKNRKVGDEEAPPKPKMQMVAQPTTAEPSPGDETEKNKFNF